MFLILLPAWTLWTLAIGVLVAWLWIWALCRAAALGDEMMLRLLRDPAGRPAARAARDGEAKPSLTPQRPDAAEVVEEDFPGGPVRPRGGQLVATR